MERQLVSSSQAKSLGLMRGCHTRSAVLAAQAKRESTGHGIAVNVRDNLRYRSVSNGILAFAPFDWLKP